MTSGATEQDSSVSGPPSTTVSQTGQAIGTVGDTTDSVAQMVEPWDIVADGYTSDILPMSEHFAREALKLAELPPSPHIVDVATGPGPLALLAARDGATVSAIDFSPAMVASLQRRAEAAGLLLADVRVGDGQDLPYDDETFDGAFSMLGLIFFPDRVAGFRELRRVLRPERRAVVSSMSSLSEQFRTAMKSIGAVLPDLPAADGEPPLSNPEDFEREMSAAGFRRVTIHTFDYNETSPTLASFWGKVQRGAAFVATLKHKMGRNVGPRFRMKSLSSSKRRLATARLKKFTLRTWVWASGELCRRRLAMGYSQDDGFCIPLNLPPRPTSPGTVEKRRL